MKKIFITILMCMFLTGNAMAASIFYPSMNGILNRSGNVASFGNIYFYEVGTYTEKDVYSNRTGTVYPQPISLDGSGKANIWIDGVYRVYIRDRNGNVINDVNGVVSTEGLSSLASINDIGDVSVSTTEGSIGYRNSVGNFVGLTPGTSTYVLTTNGAGNPPSWDAIPSGVTTLGELSDVTFGGLADGQVLRYSGASTEWQNTALGLSDISNISFVGTPSQGSVLYNDGSDWTQLEPGTSGELLMTKGAGANPEWEAVVASSGSTGDILAWGTTGWIAVGGATNEILYVTDGATVEWGAPLNGLNDVDVSEDEGTLLYRDNSGDVVGLAPGAAGSTLTSGGAAAAPTWGSNPMPVGTVLTFAGTSAPTGFVLCDGSAINRTTYSALFGVINVLYGPGDSSTTFNVPDMRDRFVAGSGTTYSEGDTGGLASVTLTAAQSGVPAHTHPVSLLTYTTTVAGGVGTYPEITGTITANTSANIAANASASHENRPPYLAMNYIIKY